MILVHSESTDIKQKPVVKNKRNYIPLSIFTENTVTPQFCPIIFIRKKETIEKSGLVSLSFRVCSHSVCGQTLRLSVCAQHADENVIDSFFSLAWNSRQLSAPIAIFLFEIAIDENSLF